MLKNYCCLFEIQISLGNPLWEEIFAGGSNTGFGAEDPCVVRPFKVAVLLLSLHPQLHQALLHSHDYPILLIIGVNQ